MDKFLEKRKLMIQVIRNYGVKDENILKAMLKIPRHLFIPREMENYAYEDMPLHIGNSQTISKLRSVQALGIPIIRQIDANGETVDSWRLMGAWIKDVEFGELNYDEEDLMAIDVTLRYDYAYNTITQPEKAVFPSNNPKED